MCCCDSVTAKKCKYSQLLTIHFSAYTIHLIGTALQPYIQEQKLRNWATATLCAIFPALEINSGHQVQKPAFNRVGYNMANAKP